MILQGIRRASVFLDAHENLIFYMLMFLHVVPIWAFNYFPSQDGPSHLYNAIIIRDYFSGDNANLFRSYYTLRHVAGANWLGHITLAGLTTFLSPLIADKIFLTGYVFLFLMGIRFSVSSISSNATAVAFCAFPIVYNFPL